MVLLDPTAQGVVLVEHFMVPKTPGGGPSSFDKDKCRKPQRGPSLSYSKSFLKFLLGENRYQQGIEREKKGDCRDTPLK